LTMTVITSQSRIEMGQYIENIVDISSIYRYRYRTGTLDIVFFNISKHR